MTSKETHARAFGLLLKICFSLQAPSRPVRILVAHSIWGHLAEGVSFEAIHMNWQGVFNESYTWPN